MDRHEAVSLLNEIGMLLEIKGENPFMAKAYYDAARVLESSGQDLGELVESGELGKLKGIGKSLARKITELYRTGQMEYYNELKASLPEELLEMLRIPGLGPRKVGTIHRALGVTSIADLKKACLENAVANLPGFGEKTQARILEAIKVMEKYAGQHLFPDAMRAVERIKEDLEASGLVSRLSEAGSLRRRRETVSDIDILVLCRDRQAVLECLANNPLLEKLEAESREEAKAVLAGGFKASIHFAEEGEYPYALLYLTGSQEHYGALCAEAARQGKLLDRHGLYKNSEAVACYSEEDIYRALGMAYVPPELRETGREVDAARRGEIPRLIKAGDIKGVLHVHTSFSDGTASMEDMVRYCIQKGYTYLGISDHSQTAYYAGGLLIDDIKRQHEEIDRLNEKYKPFRILKGIELDILPDGSVDYPEEVLEWFDFTVASIHSSFRMEEDRMTRRVIDAMKNRYVTILGHPTGRLLLRREAYRINLEEVIKAAAREGVILEINCNPYRLDLDWRYCKMARELGCSFAVCPDAHDLPGIDDMAYGINVARKGWLTAEDVVNTCSVDGLMARMRRR